MIIKLYSLSASSLSCYQFISFSALIQELRTGHVLVDNILATPEYTFEFKVNQYHFYKLTLPFLVPSLLCWNAHVVLHGKTARGEQAIPSLRRMVSIFLRIYN